MNTMTRRPRSSQRPIAAGGVLAVLALAVTLSIATADAGVFYDATVRLNLGDDDRIFVNVANDYFAPAPAVSAAVVERCPSPVDDYPVIMLMARASRRPPEEILKLRLDYLPWSDIMVRLNVSPGFLFAGLDRDPGPPYGKAWGYWRHHPRGEAFEIRDRDVVELAKLQVAAGFHHVSPYTVIAQRQKGVKVVRYVADKNRGRYARQDASAREQDQGGGHGKGKGHSKSHPPRSHPHDHD